MATTTVSNAKPAKLSKYYGMGDNKKKYTGNTLAAIYTLAEADLKPNRKTITVNLVCGAKVIASAKPERRLILSRMGRPMKVPAAAAA